MTLTKNKMIREIGRRTRLKNRDVQVMLEALIDIWIEELINGGRIELENFFLLETKVIDRGERTGKLLNQTKISPAPRIIRRIVIRLSKKIRNQL